MTRRISAFQPATLVLNASLAAALLTPTSALHAQPDAGQLLNQQQRQTSPPGRSADPREAAPQALPTDGSTAFRARIRAIRFSGADGLLTPQALQAVVADAIGRELTHAQLQALAARVTAALQQRGFPLARAYLPRQDLTDGELEIAVLQGRLERGARRLQVANASTVSTDWIQAIAGAALPAGTLRTEDLERALLLLNDLSGVNARARLERGSEPGTSRLVVQAEPTAPLRAQLGVDNFLNRYTGDVRGQARLTWANPSGVGDSLGLGLNLSKGNQGVNAAYDRVLTPSGLRLTMDVSTLAYQIGRELKPLKLEGHARALTATLSHPVQRSRTSSVWLAADAEARSLRDDSLAGNLRDRRLKRLRLSAYGNSWDVGALAGMDWSVAVAAGRVDLSGNADDLALDQRTAGTHGPYAKLTAQLSRAQTLGRRGEWTLFGGLSAQLADGNLDSSEKFLLGGPSGVRAHAVGEASGDTGWLGTLELRRDFSVAAGVQAQALAFVDAGRVQLHKRPWTGALPVGRDNAVNLSGVGIGLNLYASGWQLRSAVARSTSGNEARQPDGRDADGRRSRTRIWLQAGTSF